MWARLATGLPESRLVGGESAHLHVLRSDLQIDGYAGAERLRGVEVLAERERSRERDATRPPRERPGARRSAPG